MKAGIKVFAPASVANVACGFDILGFALDKPGDEIVARFSDTPGITISKITGAKGKLPYEVQKNTAGYAAQQVLDYLGDPKIGIELEIHKKMPFGSGLGSSAASAAAGVMAVNELLKRPLEKRELLPFAVAGEQIADGAYHADNVAPSLLGGFQLIRDNETLDVHRLPVPKGLFAVVIHPQVQVLTKEARAILSPEVPFNHCIRQTGNLGGLIIGLYQSDLELIARSLQDWIVEPQRSKLIPHFDLVKAAALENGALGCSISGAGPSIFALCANNLIAENTANAMQRIYADRKIEAETFISTINQEGAIKF
ncbi:MAG: homoserine kinase [Phaeodactylibacter sp.]|nr:homoserine kinase [Phaeodactylibacter sp.]